MMPASSPRGLVSETGGLPASGGPELGWEPEVKSWQQQSLGSGLTLLSFPVSHQSSCWVVTSCD